MKTAILLSGVVLCLILIAAPRSLPQQAVNSNDEEQSKILALENAWNRAEQQKDAIAMSQLLASTLVYTDTDGTFMNKSQFIQSVKASMAQSETLVTENVGVQMYGDTAIVTGVFRDKGVLKGKPFTHTGRFTDTWVKRAGSWECVASHASLISKN